MAIDLTQTGILAVSLNVAHELFSYLIKRLRRKAGDDVARDIRHLKRDTSILLREAKRAGWDISIWAGEVDD